MEKVTAAESGDDYGPLVRAAANGDPAAMDLLLGRAQNIARRFSLAVCGDETDAEDALQEALLKTYRSARQIRDANAFRPWLYRVVRNACLVSRRKRAHEPPRLESLDATVAGPGDAGSMAPADPGRDPEQLAEDNRRRRRLRIALAAIPRAYRIVLFLRDMEGLSTREVARVLQISEDNVKTRLRRARSALQAEMQRRHVRRPIAREPAGSL
jgi:RNA polymerase sigma-70 factor (ECF subfamily)